jgi:hypothetical protein
MLPWIVGIGALFVIIFIWIAVFRLAMRNPNSDGGGKYTETYNVH